MKKSFRASIVLVLSLFATTAFAQQASNDDQKLDGADLSGAEVGYSHSFNQSERSDLFKLGAFQHSIGSRPNDYGTRHIEYKKDGATLNIGRNYGITTKGVRGYGMTLMKTKAAPYVGLKTHGGFEIAKHQLPSFNIIDPELEAGLAVTMGNKFNLLLAPSAGFAIGQEDDANFGVGRKFGAQGIMSIGEWLILTASLSDAEYNGNKGKTNAVTKEINLSVRTSKKLAIGAYVSDKSVKTVYKTGEISERRMPVIGARVLIGIGG